MRGREGGSEGGQEAENEWDTVYRIVLFCTHYSDALYAGRGPTWRGFSSSSHRNACPRSLIGWRGKGRLEPLDCVVPLPCHLFRRQRAFIQGLLLLLPSEHRAETFFRKRRIRDPATMNVTVPLELRYDPSLSEHKVRRASVHNFSL